MATRVSRDFAGPGALSRADDSIDRREGEFWHRRGGAVFTAASLVVDTRRGDG